MNKRWRRLASPPDGRPWTALGSDEENKEQMKEERSKENVQDKWIGSFSPSSLLPPSFLLHRLTPPCPAHLFILGGEKGFVDR